MLYHQVSKNCTKTAMTFNEWLTEHPYMGAALQKELGVTRSAVWQAKNGSMPIPFSWNAVIEKLSYGKIKASALDAARLKHKHQRKAKND